VTFARRRAICARNGGIFSRRGTIWPKRQATPRTAGPLVSADAYANRHTTPRPKGTLRSHCAASNVPGRWWVCGAGVRDRPPRKRRLGGGPGAGQTNRATRAEARNGPGIHALPCGRLVPAGGGGETRFIPPRSVATSAANKAALRISRHRSGLIQPTGHPAGRASTYVSVDSRFRRRKPDGWRLALRGRMRRARRCAGRKGTSADCSDRGPGPAFPSVPRARRKPGAARTATCSLPPGSHAPGLRSPRRRHSKRAVAHRRRLARAQSLHAANPVSVPATVARKPATRAWEPAPPPAFSS